MTAVDITKYVIGKARIGMRAVGVASAYTVIPSIDDTVIRINTDAEEFDPSTDLDVGGPVQGFQYAARVGGAEAEFSIAQLDATNLGLMLPGSTSAAAPTTTTSGGGSTTTTAAAAVGDTSLALTSATNFSAGDFIKIDTGGNIEYRQITAVNSLVVSFFAPLSLAHASGVAVLEVDGDGRTTFSPPAQGRIASASYKEFRIDWQRPDGAPGSLVIYRGLPKLGETYELTTGSRTMARAKVTISAFRDPANVEAAPFGLIL